MFLKVTFVIKRYSCSSCKREGVSCVRMSEIRMTYVETLELFGVAGLALILTHVSKVEKLSIMFLMAGSAGELIIGMSF